jgi:hypothetical protein
MRSPAMLSVTMLLAACANPGMFYGHGDGGADANVRSSDAGADASARVDSGSDAFTVVDAFVPGSDAFVGIDAFSPGVDAFVPGVDAWVQPVDAAVVSDAGHDAGHDAGAVTPGPGSYLYTRTPVGGMHEAVVVAFHPDGSYALVLERDTNVRVYDWAARTAVAFDVRVGGRALTLTDVSFDPAGGSAQIVGYETVSGANTGVMIRFDDATWRSAHAATAFTRSALTRAGERFTGIERPAAGEGPVGDGRPVVLSASGTSPYIARLRDLDVSADAFGSFLQARPTSAGCDDLAFADNELGTWGIVLACGVNGSDNPYYTEIGGVGEWRPGPAGVLGNNSRAASHGSGDYALVVSWSGRDLDRFQAGSWHPAATTPGWAAIGVWDVSFSPDGARALIVGRASGSPLVGTVLEYRHDLYTTGAITNVSIPGFASAPYIADSNYNLNDSAFRPGCDGGLVVGGETSFSTALGMIVEFQIEGGRACR